MDSEKPQPARAPGEPPAVGPLRDRALGIIAFATVLGLLYLGRTVLIPFTVALMLSLLVSPIIRRLRRIGFGPTSAVLTAVLGLALMVAAAAAILGTQVLHMAAALPQYEKTIQGKLHSFDALTVGRLDVVTSEASRLLENQTATEPPPAPQAGGSPLGPALLPVEVHQPRPSSWQVMAQALASAWEPVASSGIVLVVLVFVLLEHESLRDRFIRVLGGTNIRLTTLALNDAGERLSRFFASQFAVNVSVGATIALGLAVLGVPQAILWGALATLLRFVPYLGIWIAAFLATALAIAVTPGWSLAVYTLCLFVVVEFVAGQIVEPNLYGHTTGLSPLSVVVAAIFWSALWGPIGLVLSTPLTLCLLVIGRHIRALSFLDLLLGDAQALTLAQKFYQRALSGDAEEIVAVARAFLKRNSFASYCDIVLLPALQLAFLDRAVGAITQEQQLRIRDVLVTVVSALSNEPRQLRRRLPSVLVEQNAGLILRGYREQLAGRWQGPLEVARGSILLCLGLGSPADTIAAELLVRALREQRLDARHISLADLAPEAAPPDADPAAVGAICLVSALPNPEREQAESTIARVRQVFAAARVILVRVPGISLPVDLSPTVDTADASVTSFAEVTEICLGAGRGTIRDAAKKAAA
jgi:predicted PurR-regulated permease PerM